MSEFIWKPTRASLTYEPVKVGSAGRRVWSLYFANRAETTAAAIEAFVMTDARMFDWTPPTGAAGQWFCDPAGLRFEVVPPGRRSVSAVFKELD